MQTVPARDVQPGDRIQVAPNLTRTFAYRVDTGMTNRRNVPVLALYYREGDTAEWGCGNTWAADSPVEVERGA